MALPPVQKNWGLFYFNSKLNFRHPPRCDKVDFWPIHCAVFVDISAARTHDEWVNIDEHKRCTRAIFSCYCWRGGGEKRRGTLWNPPGIEEPLSIFRIFPVKFRKRYQSHFEALGLHLFVRDAERCSDDCANSSNPTYSRSSHTLKHAYTPCTAKHLPLSSACVSRASVSSALESALCHSEVLIEEALSAAES